MTDEVRDEPREQAQVADREVGLHEALHDARVRVPGQVSVIAIHDVPMAEMLHPALTTVHIKGAAIGRQAAQFISITLDQFFFS